MDEQTATLGEARVNYHIKTEQFEGPLDLLLSLIEKRKLFISDFSLADVANEYIEHIRRFESFPMNDVANFLLVASTLVLIKSKSILPAFQMHATASTGPVSAIEHPEIQALSNSPPNALLSTQVWINMIP